MGDLVGEQLGNYRLLRLLGRGGFAEVYLGEHVYLQNRAAVKVLHARLSEEEAARFVTEARTLARLSHPHIVRVLDFAVQESIPFLVMEYAPGGPLYRRHPSGTRLPLDTIVTYMSQVASALQYAHDQQLVHRDVKPENMLLNAREEVLLADFGLAMLAPSISPGSTQAIEQQLVGTTPYLAPEQLRGQPRPASDQYALGVVVYEWITGERPFRGPPIEVALQHVSARPPSLRDLVPGLLPVVEEVVLRALAKEPEDRFPAVRDFATALQHACQETPSVYASPVGSGDRSCASSVASHGHAQEPSSSKGTAAPGDAVPPGDGGTRHTAQPPPQPMWQVPTVLTSLVGRERDVAAACALLSQPGIRLVTLVGAGGIGKTRLGIEIATRLREQFADAVCFVALAPISDPDLVLPTIAHNLGIQEEGTQPLLERAIALLRGKPFLLVLDNFEQVIAAAPFVEDVLVACPHLSVLVTSREVLRLQGEQVFPVPPLALPDLAHLPTDGDFARYAAVALFVQRAGAVLPTFQLTAANARAIAELCVRLDGLPLAIELAVARIKLLPPQALLARLIQRFQLLTSGAQDMPARQQTLRNTVQWSYNLLNIEEQRLFRRLSVFVGGCTLEAVETICAALSDGDATIQVLDTVASLIDKSLLQQTEQEGEEPRLSMLETVREYGLECLSVSGEAVVTRRAHAHYYLSLAEKAEPHLIAAEQLEWLDRLEREQDNLRATLSWLMESEEMEMALRLCAALLVFWLVRAHLSEVQRWLEKALAGSSAVVASVRAKALFVAARIADHRNDYDHAVVLNEESLKLYRELGDKRGIAITLNSLGHLALAQGDYAGVRTRCQESLPLLRELGERFRLAEALILLAYESHARGDYATARVLGEESLALCREVGGYYGIAQGLHDLGYFAYYQHDFVAAYTLYNESLVVSREMGAKWLIAACLEGLAAVIAAQDSGGTSLAGALWAARLCGAAEALREAVGAPIRPFMRSDYERMVAATRTQLGKEAFATAWAEGRTMTLEQVLVAPEPAAMIPSNPARALSTPSAKAAPSPADLTDREVEVLRLVAQGLTDAQVAKQLVISPRTVNWHLTSIYSKLGVSSRSAATRYAIEQQLL